MKRNWLKLGMAIFAVLMGVAFIVAMAKGSDCDLVHKAKAAQQKSIVVKREELPQPKLLFRFEFEVWIAGGEAPE